MIPTLEMASCPFPISTSTNHRHALPLIHNCATTTTNRTFCFVNSSSSCSSFSEINTQRSFPVKRKSWSGCCHASGPQSEPPSEKLVPPPSGVAAMLSRFQDTLQIFFAVLFWMSLFFWSSAWDGRNGGRPNKGS